MKKHKRAGYLVIGVACVAIALAGARAQLARGPSPMRKTTAQGEKTVTDGNELHAKGTFEPTLVPQLPEDKGEGSTLGRMTIAKKFHGDLEGTSEGQMLTAVTNVKGSMAYVAIERVTGTLSGRRGSFVLQHSGTMNRGAPQLSLTVVPDSGTDALVGIAGTMAIQIAADGKHSYEFDYTLPVD